MSYLSVANLRVPLRIKYRKIPRWKRMGMLNKLVYILGGGAMLYECYMDLNKGRNLLLYNDNIELVGNKATE